MKLHPQLTWRLVGLLVICCFASACALSQSNYRIQSAYSAMLKADLRQQPYPVPSTIFTADWTVAEAYATQALLVKAKLRNDKIGGFKAGLTTKSSWENFGLSEPLLGVLPASGALAYGAHVSRQTFRELKVETEIAFIVGQPIVRPLADIASLQQHIVAIAPAIELPDLSFRKVGSLNGKDIIAANATAAAYMLGTTLTTQAIDLSSITATLKRDGLQLGQGRGSDAMGDPWQAALWLVNKAIALGYRIEPGYVLLSGALPAPYDGLPGRYQADFGTLGQIEFEVH